MKLLKSEETASEACDFPEETQEDKPSGSSVVEGNDRGLDNGDAVLDVFGKTVEFPVLENAEDSVEGLYFYKNVYNLIPKSLGGLARLKTLKFFGNEINLFAPEFGNLTGLECLQMKISSPGIGGLPLQKLKGLKELELSKVPPRPSAFPILTEVAGLDSLTKLSICHFSIRYLPPEIGLLKKLEYLDLSFNKMKTLPSEISYLNGLISLKVSNNKLVELPSTMASLSGLENLDLSNNRLTSLGPLELGSMHKLQNLNLQFNKLRNMLQIPSWICCNMEGNDKGESSDDFSSSSVEMDVNETSSLENDGLLSHAPRNSSSSLLTSSSSSSRCFATHKSGKRWKRQRYLQQKARQECLNNSRKWKGLNKSQPIEMSGICESENKGSLALENCREAPPDSAGLDDEAKRMVSEETGNENVIDVNNNEVGIEKQFSKDCCSSKSEDEKDASLCPLENGPSGQDNVSSSESLKHISKSKRHSERDLDNPKPCKSRKPIGDSSSLSYKYSRLSFCGTEDHMPDGFYDAGRDQPFMSLESYEQNHCLASREVILLDREKDEELDAITLSAQSLVFHLKQLNDVAKHGNKAALDSFQVASFLALFVSDHFGGNDRGAIVERTRKSVSGSNYHKPFVCTCSTGSSSDVSASSKLVVNSAEDITLTNICEKSLESIKRRRSSIIVPIGSVQFGVCRHRALLLKYLCDRMEPPIPCELVRGFLDFSPHAWNTIVVNRGDTQVRMLVDACRPHDIREEEDPEFFCRYIPLSRTKVPISPDGTPGPGCSFPSLSTCDEFEKASSSTLVRCKFGSIEAAAKVRTLEVKESSPDKVKNFEYNCLGEVRILGALKHPCIVEMYGHQISYKWTLSEDGKPEHCLLRSAIFMEYIEGGSLRTYLDKLSKAGEKHVPVELAFYIAKDVACALSELHSKHIIHRDIKSENILIALERKKDDGTPTVKLCDFDSAVPLRSPLHSCCIAHVGTPPPYVCTGTPRWMAPEVMRTMYKENTYGLEADIWSFGCLLLELLTLRIPYSGLPDLQFHDILQMGKPPQLTEELEALCSLNEPTMIQSSDEPEKSDTEVDTMKFLVDLFRKCVEENPAKRPTAKEIYEMLLEQTGRLKVEDVRKS
ncbi:uncharacterized protein LOC129320211 isoform X1 [Prosopis cineraria]|uniref:uncharacterized protein LOC129320211 isoform X1 n=1 Tax=Prosopis cineraria TaxID=364024 RepID=UPI00240F5FCD|nr:uncharacterized protein LOC129320211 isoform X1 [Prosopis cineraria]